MRHSEIERLLDWHWQAAFCWTINSYATDLIDGCTLIGWPLFIIVIICHAPLNVLHERGSVSDFCIYNQQWFNKDNNKNIDIHHCSGWTRTTGDTHSLVEWVGPAKTVKWIKDEYVCPSMLWPIKAGPLVPLTISVIRIVIRWLILRTPVAALARLTIYYFDQIKTFFYWPECSQLLLV